MEIPLGEIMAFVAIKDNELYLMSFVWLTRWNRYRITVLIFSYKGDIN